MNYKGNGATKTMIEWIIPLSLIGLIILGMQIKDYKYPSQIQKEFTQEFNKQWEQIKMTEIRANHLKTLIRHSSKTELTMPKPWFMDTPCSDRMSKQKKEIQEAIEYLKKDGNVDIKIKEGEEYYTIKLEAV